MRTVSFLVPPGPLTVALISDVLGLVMDANEVPRLGLIHAWTELEKLVAYDWAMRTHLRAGDCFAHRWRERPWFIKASRP